MRRLLGILSLVCILLGILNAVQISDGYKKGREEYHNLKELYTVPALEENYEKQTETVGNEEKREIQENRILLPEGAPKWSEVDFIHLQEISSDVVAWIEIPGIDASYPVMQAGDNDYYLHRDINGEYLFAGSIFMDTSNDRYLRNMNTIIYGHNMNDRSMFGKLRDYRNQEFYEENPYFWIYTPEGGFLYQIFSVHLASDGSSTYILRFADANSFEQWLRKMQEVSEITSDIATNITDQIITLSTCTGNGSEKQVVQGLLIADVRDNEVTRLR